MRLTPLALMVSLVACSTGGTGTNGTNGTTGATCNTIQCGSACCTSSTDLCIDDGCCPSAQICGTDCCSPDGLCLPDPVNAANVFCAEPCTNTTDCLGINQNLACCSPVFGADGGNYCQPANCGSQCCDPTTSACYHDGPAPHCVPRCTTSAECPVTAPCCQFLPNAEPDGGLLTSGSGGCLPLAEGSACLCGSSSECTTACCAPMIDSDGGPQGPYVCKANDGASYDCCNGQQTCADDTQCCIALSDRGDSVCTAGCMNSSTCGAATCETLSSGSCAGNPGYCRL